jgi:hypothetical protein
MRIPVRCDGFINRSRNDPADMLALEVELECCFKGVGFHDGYQRLDFGRMRFDSSL